MYRKYRYSFKQYSFLSLYPFFFFVNKNLCIKTSQKTTETGKVDHQPSLGPRQKDGMELMRMLPSILHKRSPSSYIMYNKSGFPKSMDNKQISLSIYLYLNNYDAFSCVRGTSFMIWNSCDLPY